jgi:hypothetical protein
VTVRAERSAAAAAMVALSVALTWPLVLQAGRALPGDLADPLLNTFTLAWDADRAAHGFQDLWNAPFFFPARNVLAYSDHLLGVALFTAPIQWLTGNAVLAYDLAFIASYAFAGFAAYLLGRRLWGSPTAGWVTAVAFAAAPHRAMHISHLQILVSGWLALALWGLHGYLENGSRRALATCTVSYVLLALSSSYLMFFGAVLLALVSAGSLPGAPAFSRGTIRRRLGELAAALALVAIALAPVAVAYLRVRQATGLRRSVGEMTAFSARTTDYLTLPPGLRAWSGILGVGVPERMLFPGVVVVLLTLVAAAAAAWRLGSRRSSAADRITAVYAVALVACTWMAFGPGIVGPYRWLVAAIPGVDGLRVPARFAVVAALPLALLAGRGAQELARIRPGRRGAWVPVACAALLIAEGFAAPLPLAAFDAAQRERASLNGWLRAAPPGGVVELPIAGPAFQPFTTAYQYNALIHHHPVVNGYTGTGYGLQDFLAGPATPLASGEAAAAVEGMRSIGVQYLVLHRAAYERWQKTSAQALVETMDGDVCQVASRVEFGDAVAWRLAPLPWTAEGRPLRRVPPDEFRATASRLAEDVRLAFDGRLDTRWTTGAPQAGGEWFELTFSRDTDIARLVLRSDRAGHAERPSRLVVEGVDASGAARVLFDGSLVPSLVRAFAGLTDGPRLDLPPNQSRTLRLRQTGRRGRLSWSIQELELYAR